MESNPFPLLQQLRVLLVENNLDAYIIPHADPHQSEILPACDERLKFISGFSGSNGTGIVTRDQALMWTDGRYYLQALKELKKGWNMMKIQSGEVYWIQWILQNLKANSRVGVNPFLIGASLFERITEIYKEYSIELVALEKDLIEPLWADRPSKPTTPIFIFDTIYSGRTAEEKLQDIGRKLQTEQTNTYIVTSLEEIAWTLNLRGSDCDETPYFTSYLILNFQYEPSITAKGILYCSKQKTSQEVVEYLNKLNIEIRDYEEILNDIRQITGSVFIDKAIATAAICESISKNIEIKTASPNIIENLKAVKNNVELQGFVNCHIRDGAANVKYFAWLEHSLVVEKREDIDEHIAAMKLKEFKGQRELNKGLSFPTISSIGANGAVIHYEPSAEEATKLNTKEIYLCDAGGQYLDGTTDATRTTHFGTPNQEEIDAYTRVLLGNLDVERVVFPDNQSYNGGDIDALARRHLWKAGLDFQHATGHGVGHFLNVHEGPHCIAQSSTPPFVEGMVVTNEPGYYKDGAFGIRIENVLIVEKRFNGTFLGFKNITLIPYERKLINLHLLSDADIKHIDDYHQKVYDTLSPIFTSENDQISLSYLTEKTRKLRD